MIDEAQVYSHPDWDDVINLTLKVNEVIRALNTAEAGKQSDEAPAQQANTAIAPCGFGLMCNDCPAIFPNKQCDLCPPVAQQQ
jgi:hypothetical protein